MEAKMCGYFQTGFCKFGEICIKQHVKEICLKINCKPSDCRKRHPKLCKHFSLKQTCRFGDLCAYKHIISSEKSDIIVLQEKIETLQCLLNDMNSRVKDMESEIVRLQSKDIAKLISEAHDKVIKEDEEYKCDICDFKSLSGPGGLAFHKKWIHHSVKLMFNCKECDFTSNSVSILKNHIVSMHNVPDPSCDNFSSSREPMCETCLPFQSLNQAQYEWPSFSSSDKLKCLECIRANVDWWTRDCKNDLPEDILHIWSLDPALF